MARDIELIWVGWEAIFRIFRNKSLVHSGQHICGTPRSQPFGRYRGEGGRGADNLFLVAMAGRAKALSVCYRSAIPEFIW
jgi:hypothetical protein